MPLDGRMRGIMPETTIFNKNNIFQKFEVLKTNRNKRYRYQEFLVEGVRSLNEAVKNHWDIHSFLYNKKFIRLGKRHDSLCSYKDELLSDC